MGSILDVTFDPWNPPLDCPAGQTYGFLPVRNDSNLALKHPLCWAYISFTTYDNATYVPPTGAYVYPRDFLGIDGGFLGTYHIFGCCALSYKVHIQKKFHAWQAPRLSGMHHGTFNNMVISAAGE